MIITFSNNSGTRSMTWQQGERLFLTATRCAFLPEKARALLPPGSYPWSGDDEYWVIDECVEAERHQMICHLYSGALDTLSPSDGSSMAMRLRDAAESGDRLWSLEKIEGRRSPV